MFFCAVLILVTFARGQDGDSAKERELGLIPTIVGGVDTRLGDYPHMAALGFEGEDKIVWICGGSLVSKQFVLTAAHCINSQAFGKVKYVKLGTVLLDGGDPQEYIVSQIITHPNYKPPSVYHDIALLKLDKAVTFNKLVKPAHLFSQKEIPRKPSPRALGWGLTEHGKTSGSNILKNVILDFFTYQECQTSYASTSVRKLKNGLDDETQICAGGRHSERDTCQGDSGGPLGFFTYFKREHYLVGVTSIGKACGGLNTPSIYTRVSYYKDWIDGLINS